MQYYRRLLSVLSHMSTPTYSTLPTPIYREVTLPLTTRLLIVGDVHGCYDEFRQLITDNGFEQESDGAILSVGDLVAKGPKTREVIEYCMRRNVYAVRGNHEQRLLVQADTARNAANTNAVSSTDDHTILAHSLPDDCIKWLMDLPIVIRLPAQRLTIVHAGIKPNTPLYEQVGMECMTMRNVLDDGSVSSSAKSGRPWIETWQASGAETVVFGHDAKRRLQLRADGHAFGLDTGCVYGGQLTALKLPERTLVSVPAKMTYRQKNE